jgi:uncharacterized protein YeaO (DUF488 family)
MPYIGKIPYEEQVEVTTQYVRDQPIQELVPHILRWLVKDANAWDYFEEWYVEELMNQRDDYDGNGYEG